MNSAQYSPLSVFLSIAGLLALAACQSAPPATPTPPPTPVPAPTATASEFLYADDFSDPESGWDRGSFAEGTTDYGEGVYRIDVTAPNQLLWATAYRQFGDLRIEVTARLAEGGEDNSFGIICRHVDPENFYALVVSSDGYAAIRKRVFGGELLVITGEGKFTPVELWPGAGETVNLAAECVGDRLRLFVNGELILEAQDGDLRSGDIGLMAGTFSAEKTSVEFDDFRALPAP
ncbi:MAG: hypothetical protein HYZ26_14515 [Chloroflexi bacterium]|nr:hypothetical protein [Chloroflexota bacterium]